MRKWVGEHPWRLEIVPFLAFAVVVWVNIFYVRVLLPIERNVKLDHDLGPLSSFFVMGTCVFIFHWVHTIGSNHIWVTREAGKRFNFMVPFSHAVLLLWAWGVLNTYCVIYSGLVDLKLQSGESWVSLAIVVALGLGTSCWLEATRRHVEFSIDPEPAVSPREMWRVGDSFRYRETIWDRQFVVEGVVLWGIAAVSWQAGAHLSLVAMMFALGVLFQVLLMRTVTLTKQEIRFSNLLMRKRIAVDQVVSCRPTREWMNGWRRSQPRVKKRKLLFPLGPCLEIQTKDGWTYRLGMRRPKFAAELLRPLVEANLND